MQLLLLVMCVHGNVPSISGLTNKKHSHILIVTATGYTAHTTTNAPTISYIRTSYGH